MTPPPNGTARWQLWVSIGTAAIAVFGSIMVLYWTSMTSYNNTLDLARRVSALESVTQENRTSISVMRADMVEINTQLRASIDDRNIMHAWDMRVQSMLWEKSFKGSHLPTDNAVYPNIADGKSR